MMNTPRSLVSRILITLTPLLFVSCLVTFEYMIYSARFVESIEETYKSKGGFVHACYVDHQYIGDAVRYAETKFPLKETGAVAGYDQQGKPFLQLRADGSLFFQCSRDADSIVCMNHSSSCQTVEMLRACEWRARLENTRIVMDKEKNLPRSSRNETACIQARSEIAKLYFDMGRDLDSGYWLYPYQDVYTLGWIIAIGWLLLSGWMLLRQEIIEAYKKLV